MARLRLPLRPRRISFETRTPVIFGRPGRRGQVGTAAHFRYAATPDRVGLALGAGMLAGGVVTALLAEGAAAIVVLPVGMAVSAAVLIAIGGPIWLFAHRLGRRGPVSAGFGGAVAGVLLALILQVRVIDSANAATIGVRWASVAATTVLAALVGAGVALAMWRIAYRRR